MYVLFCFFILYHKVVLYYNKKKIEKKIAACHIFLHQQVVEKSYINADGAFGPFAVCRG